jgi:oxygen-dependent protoporphyrinogen oxidase
LNIAIAGAGLAGLMAAHRLRADHEVTVYEREATPGGKIRSQQIDGFLFDWGPNAFLSNATELAAVVDELGLGDDVTQAAAPASKRFVYWNGRLHALPSKPPQALSMSLLSPLGKFMALRELFVPARDAATQDESVAAFVTRRFGAEVAQRIVAPAVLGISGGDPASTSVDALFPRLSALEREHGSVLRGMVRTRANPGRMRSFGARGMQRLTDRLADGADVRLGCAVSSVEPAGAGWRVHHAGGTSEVDAVILATPAPETARILAPCDAELSALLGSIAYVPMRVVGMAFRADEVPSLDGFGFLAARGQGVRILGALFTSTIFPTQAPDGTTYVRAFVGGATDPGIVELDEDAVQAIVRADLAAALGITAEPIAHHHVSWPQAIPHYAIGHRSLVEQIDLRLAAHRGLALTGNAYRGLGVGDTARDALAVAAQVATLAAGAVR